MARPQSYYLEIDKNYSKNALNPMISNDHIKFQTKFMAHILGHITNESKTNIDWIESMDSQEEVSKNKLHHQVRETVKRPVSHHNF